MKREYKYWPYLMLLIVGVVFSAGYLALAEEQPQQQSVVQAQSQLDDAQSSGAVAQQSAGEPGVSIKSAVVNFSKLASQERLLATPYREPRVIREPGRAPRNRAVSVKDGAVMEEQRPEALDSPAQPLAPSPPAASSFKALEDNNDSIPPDTHGAVGPNHLMVVLNTQIRIQSRTGVALSTVTLDGFWSPLGVNFTFDPKILYDPFNNRWMFTVMADADLPTSSVLIAVSQTSDPTGNWKLYKVDADSTNAAWADYPSIGFNKNWIVVSVNMFGIGANSGFKGSQIYAFNKANLYAFGASALHKRFVDACNTGAGFCAFTQAPAITYDNTLNTLYLVESWDGQTQLRIRSITGTTGANPVYSATTAFPTVSSANSWTFFPPNGDDFAPQLGSSQKIQNNDDRIQNVVYRNGSLWCAQTIFLPNSASPTRSSVQWWQLTPTGTIQQRGRIDDPTAPLTFYAFPSITVNKNNDVLIGFSRFSAQQYASANYAFRSATDAPNTLRTDVVLKAGSAPYFKIFGGDRNRWGDYSSTVVDPLNDADMWTIQEHAAPVSGGTSRWGTWWGRIGPSTGTPLIQLGTVTATDGNTGDPDTIIEPGENGNKLTVQLKNIGNGAATAVSGKLTTSTPGVTITSDMSAYPNLAAKTGAGNNSTPFMFNVASSVLCGQPLSFTLTVTFAGQSSPLQISFTVPTGNAGTPITKNYTGAAKAIPDNNPAGVNITLAVSGLTGTINDLNFKIGGTSCNTDPTSTTVGLNHSWVGDLVLTLKSPKGTVVTLISRAGGVNNSGHNFCNTVLDDEAAASSLIQNVTTTGAPYTGSFRPASSLSAFDGQNPNGTWTLNVSDRALGDNGSLRAFSLIITSTACSTTALAAPFDTSSDHALASLRANGDASPSQVGFNPTYWAVNSGDQIADAASLSAAQYDGQASMPYIAPADLMFPYRLEDELAHTQFVLKRYDYLLGASRNNRLAATVWNR